MKIFDLQLNINLALIYTGLTMSISGLIMQLLFHIGIGRASEDTNVVFGINYTTCSYVHKVSAVLFTLLMVYHVAVHWKWFKTVFRKRLFSKNKVVCWLATLFVVVTITGYIPWCIKLSIGQTQLRHIVIEIHDKLAIILLVYLVLHVTKRLKWYTSAIDKLKG